MIYNFLEVMSKYKGKVQKKKKISQEKVPKKREKRRKIYTINKPSRNKVIYTYLK